MNSSAAVEIKQKYKTKIGQIQEKGRLLLQYQRELHIWLLEAYNKRIVEKKNKTK